jgi:hypothetical protein
MVKLVPTPPTNVLDNIEVIVDKYIWVTPEERLLIALWILHTYVFYDFNITPRLAILSPVFGAGKTTLLVLVQNLSANAVRYNNVTAALVYNLLDTGSKSLLLDEANHQQLFKDGTLRAVLNSNRKGDKVGRATGGKVRDYPTYTPIAVAGVGKLPNDLMQRCVAVHIERHHTAVRLDENNVVFKKEIFELIVKIQAWVETCHLDPNPNNPVKVRYADNWRPLLAIADSLGRGTQARELAVKLCSGLPDDDLKVYLLQDIRHVFGDMETDRLSSLNLLGQLFRGGPSGTPWSEWTGLNDERQPHKLTVHELSRILRDFKIYPRTVSQLGSRFDRGPSARGYFFKDFERAWASYCPNAPTNQRTESNKIESPPVKEKKRKRFKISEA